MRLLYLLTFLLCTSLVFSQPLTQDERLILQLQDQRSSNDGRLRSYLTHADSLLRYRAAIAFANIQDTSTVRFLVPLLKDPASSVRAAAAFALGEIGSQTAEQALLDHLQEEPNLVVFGQMTQALGRVGTPEGLDALVEYGPTGLSTEGMRHLAMGLLRFSLRGMKSERSIWLCFDLLQASDADTRWLALQALWRIAPQGQIDVELAKRQQDLRQLTNDPSPEVRMHFATLLGRSRSGEAMDLLLRLHRTERDHPDWRVQVQLVRALSAHASADTTVAKSFLSYLRSPNAHVKIAALQAVQGVPGTVFNGGGAESAAQSDLLRLASADDPEAELVRGEAMVALARHLPNVFSSNFSLTDPSLSIRTRTKAIEAASLIPSKQNREILLRYLTDDTVRVAITAWDFIRRYFTPGGFAFIRMDNANWREIAATFSMRARSSLRRGDMAITNLVAQALRDTSVFGLFRNTSLADSLVEELAEAYKRLRTPNDVETMQAVVEALGGIGNERVVPVLERALNDPDKTVATAAAAALKRLTGKDYSSRIPLASKPLYTNYDWQALESIPLKQRVSIRTTKGKFVLQLLRDKAPFTVLSFVTLSRKGFYDGLSFHRVVPNFVVQGGDPRGDGWGGPGYSIRSEVALVDFRTGSVGIASAGKDTEGCQFFITHSPQPHLSGRYTVFAEVVEGMEVVDRLQVGDRILGIALE